MSTTKLLTALIVLKYCKIDETVNIIDDDMDEKLCIVSSCIFQSGDIVNIKELLYAALLPSSNQAANILARITGEKIINNEIRKFKENI